MRPLRVLVLGGAGFLINLFPLPLYPSIDFLLGPTLVMIAGVAGGPWLGALAGFLTSLPTLFLWEEWFGILQFTLEGLVVGALASQAANTTALSAAIRVTRIRGLLL